MTIIDIMLNSIRSYITNTSEKLSRTPKMSFAKMPSQPWMLTKQLVRRNSLKQLQSLTNTHRRRNLDKHVHMVRLNDKFINYEIVLFSNFTKKLLTILTHKFKFKRVFRILGLPNQVINILTHTMTKIVQTFHFSHAPRVEK